MVFRKFMSSMVLESFCLHDGQPPHKKTLTLCSPSLCFWHVVTSCGKKKKKNKKTTKKYVTVHHHFNSSEAHTVKHLISAVSYFRGLLKMTYWHILIFAFMIYHGSIE